ncbi:MAG: IS481 family transposase [Nitrospinae bacterium]|nr:IS481 family transposase [Nitrospinota bacterium]
MVQVLHKRATTTQAIRKRIQEAEGSYAQLAKRFNVNIKTIQTWRNRDFVEDKPMGNGRKNSVLTLEDESIICKVRKKTWLPLDDLLDLLKRTIPKLTRSNLHRCLQHYGISRPPKESLTKRKTQKFKVYEIGFIHIDITDFWLKKKKYSLFVAIDRVSKFSYACLYENKTVESALDFLKQVIDFYPYQIHRILTDNGIQFTYRCLLKANQPKGKRHPFSQMCLDNGIKHKLTNFFSPQTNGQVERMNQTIKNATIKMFEYETVEQFKLNLEDFLNWYNMAKKLKALKRKAPYDFIIEQYKLNPKIFNKKPEHHCVGLNTYRYP